MVRRAYSPGDDVDGWCTRCKMNLNHRIIAVVGSDIKRVECLTCGSHHNYRPSKHEGGAAKSSTVRKSGSNGSTTGSRNAKANRTKGEWKTFMRDKPEDLVPRPYALSQAYKPGEYIEHPVLGTGKVLEILSPEKMQVVFEDGRKILLCNRGS